MPKICGLGGVDRMGPFALDAEGFRNSWVGIEGPERGPGGLFQTVAT